MNNTTVTVIRMREHGRRVRAGIGARQVRDQIAKALKDATHVRLDFADVESVGATFLDVTLGALVARHGGAVLRSIAFVHCNTGVEASIVEALSQVPPLRRLLDFSERRDTH